MAEPAFFRRGDDSFLLDMNDKIWKLVGFYDCNGDECDEDEAVSVVLSRRNKHLVAALDELPTPEIH